MVFGICKLIDLVVPDIPESLDVKIKRERYLAKEALQDADHVLQVNKKFCCQQTADQNVNKQLINTCKKRVSIRKKILKMCFPKFFIAESFDWWLWNWRRKLNFFSMCIVKKEWKVTVHKCLEVSFTQHYFLYFHPYYYLLAKANNFTFWFYCSLLVHRRSNEHFEFCIFHHYPLFRNSMQLINDFDYLCTNSIFPFIWHYM